MLFGRFVPIVLVLALAGSLAAQQRGRPAAPAPCPPTGRCSASSSAARVVLVAALTFFPALALGPDRGGPVMTTAHPRPAPIVDRQHLHAERTGRTSRRRARSHPRQLLALAARRAAQARPAHLAAQPGHVRRLGRLGARHRAGDRRPERVRLADRGLAVVHRAVRQPRRGRRRGPRQGAGRQPAPDQAPRPSPAGCAATGAERGRCPGTDAAGRRPGGRRGRRGHPRRRRHRRGHRHRRRVGDHRRVRAGDPRVRRRPQRGHRRHHACCPTGSSCRSPPRRASRSSTG